MAPLGAAPDEDDPEWIEMLGPFTREWPGLASPERTPLDPAQGRHGLDVLLPRMKQAKWAAPGARIGLVVADRPADVLAVIGWECLYPRGESLLPLTAVLRSTALMYTQVGNPLGTAEVLQALTCRQSPQLLVRYALGVDV